MPNLLKSLPVLFFSLMLGNLSAEPQLGPDAPLAPAKPAPAPVVVFKTSLGELQIELLTKTAPISAQNFLQYVDSGFYNGVIFHRIVPGFVVQGGGFDQEYQQKNTQPPILNESDNGEKNLRGTLSMARTADPNSATSQFFINLVDNTQLDASRGRPGYAVFGRVIEGMNVVDAMAEKPQGKHSGVFMEAPNDPIVIERAYRKTADSQTPKAKN